RLQRHSRRRPAVVPAPPLLRRRPLGRRLRLRRPHLLARHQRHDRQHWPGVGLSRPGAAVARRQRRLLPARQRQEQSHRHGADGFQLAAAAQG
ncbi:hypothetical protein BN1708_019952, partial [Verticillium longisporum]